MEERQIWNFFRPTTTGRTPHCTPFTLPSNGILSFDISSIVTLTSDVVFKPECTGSSNIILTGASSPSSFTDFRDPFYASTLPECYALAATTVISYMLVIMLLITPRTFLQEGAVVLGRRGFINGPSGSDAGIGIGGRPWLQKVAALTVAVSLTIATADTFRVAEQQYEQGYQDAQALQSEVEHGLQLKIIRVISDTFLWLAQSQTLIRLFPRQREKVIIKWTAFALITLDVLFGSLNNFVYNGTSRPRSFVDAVPALSYLFQLALSLLYCAWVVYYSITKKQYAFYHTQMRNISLVALLSLVSVLVPVVFFVLDISNPALAGWGDYVRWVGAAAASVVVWEWVERIEALERNDKKDGVLGREVFDGDEMLDATPSSNLVWAQRRQNNQDNGHRGAGTTATGSNARSWPAVTGIASRYRLRGNRSADVARGSGHNQDSTQPPTRAAPPLWPTRPLAAATPVSRTDTGSAESTVYAIRYHPIGETPPFIEENVASRSRNNSLEIATGTSVHGNIEYEAIQPAVVDDASDPFQALSPSAQPRFRNSLAKVNIFRRKDEASQPDMGAHTTQPERPVAGHNLNRWDLRFRFENFAAIQAERVREKTRRAIDAESLPLTVIPAPPRRRNLAAVLDELEDAGQGEGTRHTQSPEVSSSRRGPDGRESVFQPSHPHFCSPSATGARTASGGRSQNASDSRIEGTHVSSSRTAPLGRSSPSGFRSLQFQPLALPSQRDGLPVVVIPAPSRRPRVNDE